MLRYPFGRAAAVLLVCALVAGAWIGAHPEGERTATLTVWCFAKTHYEAYTRAIPSFEAAHPGATVKVELVAGTALTSRLQAAFLADLDVPDLTEIEISSAGGFFRGPLNDVGFADLTDRVHQSGLWDKMVQSRFAPYTSRGHIFGLPHDVHPVMLAYRRDLMESLHIDPRELRTWDDFIRVGRRVTIPGRRYMLELSDTDFAHLELCLFQRGGGYFDASGVCILDNPTAIDTMCWYVPLVAGAGKIGNTLGGGQILTHAVEDGYLLCLIAPDWRSKFLEKGIPRMSGKMALMPLPAVAPGGRRTSTWGGTMLGITRKCKRQDLAWDLAMHLYLDKPHLAERFQESNILPAMRAAWSEPAFSAPRPYWSGQPLGKLYADLAPSVPAQYGSPYSGTAKAKLGEALVACVERYRASGNSGFREFATARLHNAADQVRAQIRRNPF